MHRLLARVAAAVLADGPAVAQFIAVESRRWAGVIVHIPKK